MRKLDLDQDEEIIINESFLTPRDEMKAKVPMLSSCYQGSTVQTDKQREFEKISASKFLFKDDEIMELDEDCCNEH